MSERTPRSSRWQIPVDHMLDSGGTIRIKCPALPAQPTSLTLQRAYATGGGLVGRKVTVTVNGAGKGKVLHLCEVQVMGSLHMAPPMIQGPPIL
jgi:hypothetical protein